MRKREYVNPGDVVLVSERGFSNDSKRDIVMKYPNNHHNLLNDINTSNDIMFNTNNGDGINFALNDEEEDSEVIRRF